MNLLAGLDAHFGESRSKALTVRIVEKDRLAPVTATQEVVDRTGVLDSQLSGHHASVVRIALVVNIKNRPLCPMNSEGSGHARYSGRKTTAASDPSAGIRCSRKRGVQS